MVARKVVKVRGPKRKRNFDLPCDQGAARRLAERPDKYSPTPTQIPASATLKVG
jgi:hypothetical protein